MIEQENPVVAGLVDSGPSIQTIAETPPARRVSVVLSTSVRDLTYVVFKWKWDIFFVVLLAVAGSAVYLFLIRDTLYETTVTLLVKLGQEQAPPTTMLGDRTLLISQRPQDVTSETGVLKSTDLLQRVVTKLHLDQPAPPETAPAALLPRIKFEIKRAKRMVKDLYSEALISAGLKKRLSRFDEAIVEIGRASCRERV